MTGPGLPDARGPREEIAEIAALHPEEAGEHDLGEEGRHRSHRLAPCSWKSSSGNTEMQKRCQTAGASEPLEKRGGCAVACG